MVGQPNTVSWKNFAIPNLRYDTKQGAQQVARNAARETGNPYAYTGVSQGFTVQPQYTNAQNQPVQNAQQATGPGDSHQQQLEKIAAQGDLNPVQQSELDAYIAQQQEGLRNSINSGWDNYLNELGGLNTGLQDQRTAQEGILASQRSTGLGELDAQRTRSLRDVSSNISNAFQAGNNFLGLRGAGDSSAAGQYQFALSQEAAKQNNAVNEQYNSAVNSLRAEYDQGMQRIAQWFAGAQNEVRQLVANGQLNKQQDLQALSRDLLNNALAMKNTITQNAQNRYNALLEWAANNSSNIGQLTSNIASIPQALGQPSVDSTGNLFQAPIGTGGFDNQDNRNIFAFNNPLWANS